MTPVRRYLPTLATLLLAFLVLSFLPPVALGQATCTAPKNAIEAENCHSLRRKPVWPYRRHHLLAIDHSKHRLVDHLGAIRHADSHDEPVFVSLV